MAETSLARNTAYSALSSVSNIMLIVLVIIAARVLGDRSFGQFSFALALASIFEMVIDLGLNTLTARNVSRDRALARLYLPNILGWKIVLSLAAMGLLALSVRLLHQAPEARTAAYILGGAIVLRSFKATSHAFFQAYERFDLILLTTYVERVGVLVCGIAVLLIAPSVVAFAAAFALVRIPDLLYAYWLLRREIAPVAIRLEIPVVKRLQISAIPFGLYSLVLVTYWYVGTIVLSVMRSPAEVGWYNAGYKIYEGLTMVPFLIGSALLPRLSRLFGTERDRHTELSLRALRYLGIAAWPLIVSIGILAPQIISLLYGKSYMPAVPVLRILLGAAIFMFANWTLNTILISADMERYVVRAAIAGLAVTVTANLILVRQMGMIGAAYSLAVSEVSIFVLLMYVSRRMLFRIPAGAIAWRPTLSSASGGLVFLIFRGSPPVISALLFTGTYVVMLVALRTFDADERSAVKSLLSLAMFRRFSTRF